MNEKEEIWIYIRSKIKNEGFHYCFAHYSNFEEVEDKEFHKLRKEYLEVSKKLEEYVNKKHSESTID